MPGRVRVYLDKEVISLHIGQAGCQLGMSCWEMLCLEHRVQPDGILCSSNDRGYIDSFFKMTGAGKVVPRTCFIDLEPSIIDEIRSGKYRQLFSPQLLISGKEDAANCFARGYITLSKEIIDIILRHVRIMAEECNVVQGFLIYRACGGGTGSGLAARLLEKLSHEYPKCSLFEFAVYPNPKLSSIVVEPYNTALSVHESLEYTNGSFIIDNEATFDICDRLLDTRFPSYPHINQLLAQVVSAVTSSFRFEGSVNVDFNELKTNLIPYPRVQYPIISYAPLTSKRQAIYENVTEQGLLNACFERSNQFVKCDIAGGKYMACTILFRGDVSNASVNAAISSIKSKKSIRFVEWCPTGYKVGVNEIPPVTFPGGDLAVVDRACLMLSNSTAIKSVWCRVNHKFRVLFSKRAFLHWYISEGLEEGDFEDTRLDLTALEDDYAEIES